MLARLLDRVCDWGFGVCASAYTAKGYFPDVASATAFLERLDARRDDVPAREALRRAARLVRRGSPA